MKSIKFYLTVLCFALLSNCIAQTVSLTTTSSQCKATGSIDVGINPSPGSPQTQYTVTVSGTDIYGQPFNAGPTNTLTISAVPAGNYTVTVQDPVASFTNTQSVSVGGNYQVPGPLSNQTVTAQTTSCTGIVTPGSVTLSQPVNGLAPYTYAIGNNPTSWQSSPTFAGLAPGTYVTNAKDFCGDTRIGSVTINNTTPALAPLLPGQLYNLPCKADSLNMTIPNYISGTFTSLNLEIRNGGCAGALLYSIPLPLATTYNVHVPRVAGACYQVKGVTSCDGGTVTRQLSVPAYTFDAMVVANGGAINCAGTRNYNLVTNNMQPGFDVSFWNGDFSSQIGATANYPTPTPSSGINPNNQYIIPFSWTQVTGAYYAIVTDACGQVDTAIINHSAAPPAYFVALSGMVGPYGCEAGKSSYVTIYNIGGVPPYTYTFTSMPAGAAPVMVQKADPAYFYFNNLIPGTYDMQWMDACGSIKPLSFTVNDANVVKFTAGKLDSVTRLCGEVNSNVYFTIAGNFVNAEPIKMTVQLRNTTTGALISANNSISGLNSFFPKAQSVFTNVPAGKYVVTFKWELFSNTAPIPPAYTLGDCFQPAYDTITVLNTNVPELTNSQAFTCPGGNGIVYATATGGFAPYQYHIKQNIAGAVYGPLQTSNSFNLSGVSTGDIYNIEVVDRCGNTGNYQVAFLNNPKPRLITTTPQVACLGDFVTMSLANPFNNATYEWKNPSNTTIGTGTSIFFPSVQYADSGNYTLISTIPSCVVLTDIKPLSVINCTIPLPVTLFDLQAKRNGSDVWITWNAGNEEQISGYEIQRSVDGKEFSYLKYAPATGISSYVIADNGNTTKAYYRIKIIGRNGQTTYSNVVLVNGLELHENNLAVSPNPFKQIISVTITAAEGDHAVISLWTMDGIMIRKQYMDCKAGINKATIDQLDYLPSGAYFIHVNNGRHSSNLKVSK